MNEKIIDRIKQMEIYYDDVSNILNKDSLLHVENDFYNKINCLTDYYDSGQWLCDFECDERGELPRELKRGVLSEDGLYNLLEECKEIFSMNDCIIRKAVVGDEEVLAYIQTESWKTAFVDILTDENLKESTELVKVVEMYKRILNNDAITLYIQYVNDAPHCIAGWSMNRCGLGENVAELICIHSLQDKWRKGYGSKMMSHVLDEIRIAGYMEVVLWVFEKNIRATNFYEKHGFVLTNQRKEINGVVEVMYSKKL